MNKQTRLLYVCLFALPFVSFAEPIEPEMVTLPAGSFEMGSTKYKTSQPVHIVTLPEFSLGKYEVTVSEFRQFIAATNYPAPQECRHEMDGWFLLWTKGNWETNALNTSEYQPVVCINWEAANAYATWLAKETGKPYRLPTEAEWEYAARAGTTTDYFFGDDPERTLVCEYANTGDIGGENILQRDSNTSYYNWSGELANCNDHSAYASIVGMYKPNQFGLHDMLSNVLEFLADCYENDYTNTPRDGSPHQTQDCSRHATRGGSWHWSHWPLTMRSSQSKTFSGGVDGFRLALDGPAPELSKATKTHIARLEFAQSQEQKRRDIQRPIPEPVSNLQLSDNKGSVTLTWDYPEHNFLVSYRVYRNSLSGKMFKLIATNIKNKQFTDANIDPNKYEYTVVAVKHHMQSHYAKPVETTYRTINLPGIFEAEWANKMSHSNISFAEYDNRNGLSVAGAKRSQEKAMLEYQVNVPSAGQYRIDYHVSAPEHIEAFEIYSDDKLVGTSKIEKTGDAKVWRTQFASNLALAKGKQTLKFKALNNGWKIDWFEVQKL